MAPFLRLSSTLLLVCQAVSTSIAPRSSLPVNFTAFECAIASLAEATALSKLPAVASADLKDALNVDWLCANVSSPPPALPARVQASLHAAAAAHGAARASALSVGASGGELQTFYVATTGDDGAAGTLAAPFKTLARAAAAARAVSPRKPGDVGVLVRGGIYYLGDEGAPLTLSEADSNVSWAGFPGDPAPVLSGARLLRGLTWAPAAGAAAGTLVADVRIPDARAEAWAATHPAAAARAAAGPPPLVASLFINGVRQVRARYPNGNPDDFSGICFSATQRPGEGCAAWSSCAIKDTGAQPAPAGVHVGGFGPNRGDSPTLGCAQCGHCGSFGYTIYPPPAEHPVYNKPLPGVGWSNTSVFSFWASPFSRPAGFTLDASAHCDAHWSAVNYSSPANAVVHMFHAGLWGGWQFAVDGVNVSRAADGGAVAAPAAAPAAAASVAALFAAMPLDMTVQLKADALPASGAGKPVAAWPNSAPGGAAHGASQANLAKQPLLVATGWPGGLPAVRFAGAQVLVEGALRTPAAATLFAAVRDTGSRTDYCSGIAMLAGARYSLCTKAATAAAPAHDDDPPTVGSAIIATGIDWAGSPVDPGHRDLRDKPTVLSAVYGAGGAEADVDGCSELTATHAEGESTGYMIGSRNDEMGRYLVGDVGEVIVYPRALNSSERAAVVAYLSAKWGVATPKHCAPPPAPGATLRIDFGYGGYQEARGSGINAGQRFYIENVAEELDAPGEWFYDDAAGKLFLMSVRRSIDAMPCRATPATPPPPLPAPPPHFCSRCRPNITAGELAAAAVAVPVLDAVVVINGSQSAPGAYATDISFTGFTVTQSRVTFLEQYEVPSGGDWSVHRGAAVFVQEAERVALAGLRVALTGGNGVVLSNHVVGAAVTDCEFVRTGDSGVILLGSTDGIDGSKPTYPNHNLIARNHMHEIGVYGKQTSCVGLQLSANSTILDNVCYNGPRAGVNYNDGFGGGNLFQGNGKLHNRGKDDPRWPFPPGSSALLPSAARIAPPAQLSLTPSAKREIT